MAWSGCRANASTASTLPRACRCRVTNASCSTAWDVAFKADWQVNHPNIPAEDIANIRYGAASVFRAEFAQVLEKGGYAIAEAPGPDVLRVSASVVDLGIIGRQHRRHGRKGHGLHRVDRRHEPGRRAARFAERRQPGAGRGSQARPAVMEICRWRTRRRTPPKARAAFALWAGYLRDALDAARGEGEAAQKKMMRLTGSWIVSVLACGLFRGLQLDPTRRRARVGNVRRDSKGSSWRLVQINPGQWRVAPGHRALALHHRLRRAGRAQRAASIAIVAAAAGSLRARAIWNSERWH